MRLSRIRIGAAATPSNGLTLDIADLRVSAGVGAMSLTTPGAAVGSKVGDSIVYALTDTTEVLSTTESNVAFDSNPQTDADTFSSSAGVITAKVTAPYLIINHLAVDRGASGTNRTSGESFIHVNAALVAGAYTDGYIRRSSNADEFSDTAYGLYDLTANDTIAMRKLRINTAGSDGRVVGNITTYNPSKTALSLIKLDSAAWACILTGAAGDTSTLTAADSFVSQTWTTQTRLDAGFSHTAGTSGVTIADAGTYLVGYSNSWQRDTDNTTREGVFERLRLDGADVPGSFDNTYIRGSQSGESITRGNNSSCTIIKITGDNVLTLVSSAEAGVIDCSRLPEKSQLFIYKISDGKTFKATSTSTQDVGTATEFTLDYSVSAWMDAGFSLASNQITMANAGKMLILNSMETDSPTGARAEPFQYIRLNSFNSDYASGSGYSRNSGSMNKATPNVGLVTTVAAADTLEIRGLSLGALLSTRVANSGGFAGVDLSTLSVATGSTGIAVNDLRGFTSIDGVVVSVSSAAALMVAGLFNSVSADNLALIQDNTLAIQAIDNATTLDNTNLSQSSTITAADLDNAITLDNTNLSQSSAISTADLLAAITIDNLPLTQANILGLADLDNAITLDNTNLIQSSAISTADLLAAITIDNLPLTQANILSLAGLDNATILDNVNLSQSSALSVAELLLNLTIDNSALTQKNTLIVADSATALAVDNVDLIVSISIIIAAIDLSITTDNLSFSQAHALAVDALNLAVVIDAIALLQSNVMLIDDGALATTLAAINLTQAGALLIAASDLASTIDSIAFSQGTSLAVVDSELTTTIDDSVLNQANNLAINDSYLASTSDNVELSMSVTLAVAKSVLNSIVGDILLAQASALVVDELLHSVTVDNVALTTAGSLLIEDLSGDITIDAVTLAQANSLAVAALISGISEDNLALTIAHVLSVAELLGATSIDDIAISAASSLSVADLSSAIGLDNVAIELVLISLAIRAQIGSDRFGSGLSSDRFNASSLDSDRFGSALGSDRFDIKLRSSKYKRAAK